MTYTSVITGHRERCGQGEPGQCGLGSRIPGWTLEQGQRLLKDHGDEKPLPGTRLLREPWGIVLRVWGGKGCPVCIRQIHTEGASLLVKVGGGLEVCWLTSHLMLTSGPWSCS